ncbi:MAG: maleylpyruvate isomerase family mycothiol-dependent enzyme [Candidatus Tectomicrobia bacterium]|nr:maleylpyruvate isomerase family mycothiol-dependent enzyme [Candidatus Tectomicrobia bacterium]
MAFDAKTQLANIPVVVRQTERMLQAMRAWPETHWSRPTYCPDWTAADAVAHLVTGADFYAQVVTSGCRGNPQMPWGIKDVSEFRQTRGGASRKLVEGGPAALLEAFERESATLQEVLVRLQESELGEMAWHPRGLVPIGSWIGMRLTELAVHDWDIRQPHETPPSLAPHTLPGLCTVLPEMQLQFLAQRGRDGLEGTHVLQAGDAAWAFRVADGAATHVANAPAAYESCVSTDAESLILLSMGRADLQDKLQSGALTISGNAEKGRRLCDTLFRSF